MEAKPFIEPVLDRRGVVITTRVDVKGAFNAASWTSILQGLKEFNFPRNLYKLSKGYFSNRTTVLTMNNVSETRRITKRCPQGSCCGPGFWNVLYNYLLQIELTNHSQAIAFAEDLIVLTRADKLWKAENYMNIEMKKIMEWQQTVDSCLMKTNHELCLCLVGQGRKRKK